MRSEAFIRTWYVSMGTVGQSLEAPRYQNSRPYVMAIADFQHSQSRRTIGSGGI
jgi:hypothetical protein